MKNWIILITMVLIFAITGCSQKSRYNPPLSEDEKIMRAILKMKPDFTKIPPPEEKIEENKN